MKKLRSVFIVGLFLVLAGQPMAADWPTHPDIQGVEQLFTDLKRAYETEDIDLFLRCFDPYVTSVDIPYNSTTIYTEAMTRAELSALFTLLDNIRIDFLYLQIIVERGTAMATTLRRGAAPGFPTVYVKMVHSLRKNGNGWGSSPWQIDGNVVLDDIEVDAEPAMSSAQEAKAKEHRKLLFY